MNRKLSRNRILIAIGAVVGSISLVNIGWNLNNLATQREIDAIAEESVKGMRASFGSYYGCLKESGDVLLNGTDYCNDLFDVTPDPECMSYRHGAALCVEPNWKRLTGRGR